MFTSQIEEAEGILYAFQTKNNTVHHHHRRDDAAMLAMIANTTIQVPPLEHKNKSLARKARLVIFFEQFLHAEG
jgi:hypothetical protein